MPFVAVVEWAKGKGGYKTIKGVKRVSLPNSKWGLKIFCNFQLISILPRSVPLAEMTALVGIGLPGPSSWPCRGWRGVMRRKRNA